MADKYTFNDDTLMDVATSSMYIASHTSSTGNGIISLMAQILKSMYFFTGDSYPRHVRPVTWSANTLLNKRAPIGSLETISYLTTTGTRAPC